MSTPPRGDVFLKLETLQPTFSYKIRGAFNALLKLSEHRDNRARIVTASAGNHGRAMAYAAATLGLPLTVYAPETAPRTKLDAIRRTGATLRTCADYDDAERCAKEHAATHGDVFISPYSHPDVIAGAGTVGLEILDDDLGIDSIVVPVGGGGLISGIALAAAAASRRAVRVIGVEVAASNPFTRSLAAGRIVEIDVQPTLADGLAGNLNPETITFDLVRRLVSRIVTVDEDALRRAVRGLVIEERLVTEGAAAVGVAALLSGALEVEGARTALVISGGNIDAEKLKALL